MKDKILKLCRRMRNATKSDLLQISEIEPNVLETILMYLLDEGLLEEQNGCYIPLNKKDTTDRLEVRSLPLMIQYHSPETIDLIIRGFCEKIGCQKMCNIANVSASTITAFYNEFRKLIYERQNNKLLNCYFTNPKQCRYRQFFDIFGFFYIYNKNIYISERPLRATFENDYTKTDISHLKKVYSFIRRNIEKHKGNKVRLHYKIAEYIWRREQDFTTLYTDVTSLIA
ncbi:hypothetical protein J6P92_06440 [bacterium]|nr:hypothetical protein [bacterium]